MLTNLKDNVSDVSVMLLFSVIDQLSTFSAAIMNREKSPWEAMAQPTGVVLTPLHHILNSVVYIIFATLRELTYLKQPSYPMQALVTEAS